MIRFRPSRAAEDALVITRASAINIRIAEDADCLDVDVGAVVATSIMTRADVLAHSVDLELGS